MKTIPDILKAVADDTRLTILGLLYLQGELCVCDIEGVLQITQSKASRHLRYLKNAGLVDDRRANVWVYYKIAKTPDASAKMVLSSVKKIAMGAVTEDISARLQQWISKKSASADRCAGVRQV